MDGASAGHGPKAGPVQLSAENYYVRSPARSFGFGDRLKTVEHPDLAIQCERDDGESWPVPGG